MRAFARLFALLYEFADFSDFIWIHSKHLPSSYGYSESGTIKETITGGDQNADWTHIEHIRQYAGSETSDVYEGRSVYKRNGGLYYSFYHHEKAPMMNEFTIVRNYTLEKK